MQSIGSCAFAKNQISISPNRFCERAISAGTQGCSFGQCPQYSANLTVTRRSWLILFHRFAPENFEKALRERFSKLPRISFDYAIMEKADRVLVAEASFDWDDIGSWRAVANYL